jgi:hypothetical protein
MESQFRVNNIKHTLIHLTKQLRAICIEFWDPDQPDRALKVRIIDSWHPDPHVMVV